MMHTWFQSACCSLPQDIWELWTEHKGTDTGNDLYALWQLCSAAMRPWLRWVRQGHGILSTAGAKHAVHPDRAPVDFPEIDLGRVVLLKIGSQVVVVTYDSPSNGIHKQLCAASEHACGWYLTPGGQGREQVGGLYLQHGVKVDNQGCLVLALDLELPPGCTRADFDSFRQQHTSCWGAAEVQPFLHQGKLDPVDLVVIEQRVGLGRELMI
jgi:hypothetical protein